jgi:CheY-like chemotaxis protein
VQAILWLIDLGHPELAKPITADLAKLNLDDAQRIAIVNEFGSQGMLRIARTKDLGPEGATFADACMAAASATNNNPQRIATLVGRLTDSSEEVRTIARNDLAATGQIGVNAMLEALARETAPDRRDALIFAIEYMSPLADGPLLAMLETGDPQLRADVAALLQRFRVPQAAPLLAPDADAAQKSLAAAIDQHRRGTPPFPIDAAGQVELWNWNDTAKKLTSLRVPADDAQIIWIARLAGELARMRPDNAAGQQEALVLRLEAEGLAADKLPTQAITPAALSQGDPQMLSTCLGDALKAGYSHAALTLVEALALAHDPRTLAGIAGKPSPLAAALDSPSRRVRYAALKAIMAINPAAPYPGCSKVPDALAWFEQSAGERRAVVAMPQIARAADLAGQLASVQLFAEATNRGREAVDLALNMPDLELILVDANILAPDIRQVVYELRISPATGDIPIAILATDGRLAVAQRIASEHTRVIAASRPHTPDALKGIVDGLLRLSARDAVPPQQRVAEAEQARKWLNTLASGNRPFYTFRRMAMLPAAATATAHPPAAAPAAEDLPPAP